MTTRLRDLTIAHLGQDATEQDLEQFRTWVRHLMDCDGLDEATAIEALWKDGDYLTEARRRGLREGN